MNNFPAWLRELVGRGPWKCRCGTKTEHPGLCDTCSTRFDRERAAELIEQSVETIPARFRKCKYGSEDLAARVHSDHIRDSRSIVDDLLLGKVEGAVLSGVKGMGKTSLACAMVRELADKRAHLAWRAFYVRALDLGTSRRDAALGSKPRVIEEACGASLLVLDDLGQEADVGPLREVLHARYDDCKPSIVTTCWDDETLQARYGGGIERRVFERSAVLRMTRRAEVIVEQGRKAS